MNKPLLKFCSAILSVLTLTSPLGVLQSSAFENTASGENEYISTFNDNEDFSEYGTGDLSLEYGGRPDDATVLTTADDYYSITDNGKLSIQKSGDAILPDSVDNSESKYFPEVGNQGGIGSCVAWANTYYQYTYTVNKLMDVETTSDNTFSPKWIYNFANGGTDSGSTAESCYGMMKELGNVPITMVPYDDDYLSWSPSEEVWKTAARYRLSDYQYLDEIGTDETQITSPDDSDLELVKTALANGEVLTYFTLIYSWVTTTIKTNSDAPENDKYAGQHAILAEIGSEGSHRMTIVGYNDNIWIDVNENDKVDSGEMGAFKIVNSWGTGYGNGGYSWVAYDALNKTTSVEGGPSSDKKNRIFTLITRIDVLPYDANSNLYLTCTLNTSDRSQSYVYITAEKDGTQTTYRTPPTNVYSSKFSYDGTTNANDGVLAFPLDSVVPDITSENFSEYTWSVRFKDTTEDGNILTVKNAEIHDDNTNKVYQAENNYPVTLDGTEYTASLSVTTSNNVVVYYRGYENSFMHYKIGNGEWCSDPGFDMEECYERRGYTQKYVVELDEASDVLVYFTDEKGNIDDNNGQYFTAVGGLNYFITENAREPISVKISNDFNSFTDKHKLCKFNVEATGGYETYQYQFVYKNLQTGEEKYTNYYDHSDVGYNFPEVGTYQVTVNVKDFSDVVESASMEITVEDLPFEITEFTVEPNETILAGQELTFDALTNYEDINYRGSKSWDYDFNVKRNGKSYFSQKVFADTCSLSYKTCTIKVLWIPAESGSYSVTISRTDASENYAEKTVEFEVKDNLIGDASHDGKISMEDTLLIQLYDISAITDSDIYLDASDCNKDGFVSLRDASCAQRYIANCSTYGYVGEVIAIDMPIDSDSDSDISTDSDTDSDDSSTNTVTFTNSLNWGGTISCYYWSDSNKNMTSWPGVPMTNAGKNQYNETLYTFNVPDGATYVIFTNGSSQTVDITYSGGEVRYYPLSTTDSQGHHQVGTW